MKKVRLVAKCMIIFCLGVILIGGTNLYAKDWASKIGISPETRENIVVEMKLEFSGKGDDKDKTYTYSFEIAEGQNFVSDSTRTVPYTVLTKDDQGKEISTINFIELGETITLNPVIAGDKIILDADITIKKSYNVKIGENNIPYVNTIKHQGVSVHTNEEFIKIFSAEYSENAEAANFYIKAKRKL